MEDGFWADQRYEDMFYGLHGHLAWQKDPDCSLCGRQATAAESVEERTA